MNDKTRDQQISEAKKSYPTLITKSHNSYSIIFTDSPQNLFEFFLKSDFPNSAPLVHMNGEKIQVSITTFWHPNFTIIQLLQQLHLFSFASKNENAFLSPPMANLPSPSIYESKIKHNDSPMKFYGRLVSLSNNVNDEVIIEEEEEEPEEGDLDEKSYQEQLNRLNLKLKKRQIHLPEYIIEHQTIKKAKL